MLVLGASDVSVFAQQFARMRQLGAPGLMKYRRRLDWNQAVRDSTDGVGADHVIEVDSAKTVPRSLITACLREQMSLISRFTGVQDRIDPRPVMAKSLAVQGVSVGSVMMLERTMHGIAANRMEPVIESTFRLDDIADACA
ncbi:MAG: zinc-binding dehydrogenase [Burkholderiales bacterium]|nr:zinc-binding dehydrogenase [Burkholderiales bacterium]